MILTTPGVVLARSRLGEWDRLAYIYTRDLGRLAVRFVGADRSRGKLRALAEPFVHAEFRLYLRADAPQAKAVGGAVRTTFPSVRQDWRRTWKAFHLCELLLRLTPLGSPNSLKYELMADALESLEEADGPWLAPAFGLRLLHLSGFSLQDRPPPYVPAGWWEKLHAAPARELGDLGLPPSLCDRVSRLMCAEVEGHLEAPLRCPWRPPSIALQ